MWERKKKKKTLLCEVMSCPNDVFICVIGAEMYPNQTQTLRGLT